MQRLFGLILISCLLFSGCVIYTFNPSGESDIKNINISRIENTTSEYGLADKITDLIIDAFIDDGNMQVVALDNADAVLYGTLVGYQRKPYNWDEAEQVSEYEIIMDFDIILKDPGKDAEIWKEHISKRGYYSVENETEQDAQQEAVTFLIDDIISKTTKSW